MVLKPWHGALLYTPPPSPAWITSCSIVPCGHVLVWKLSPSLKLLNRSCDIYTSLFNCSLLKCPESLASERVWPNSALILLWVVKVQYSQSSYVDSKALSLLLHWLPASALPTFRRLIWGDHIESKMDDVVLHKNVAAWQIVPNFTYLDAVSNSVES